MPLPLAVLLSVLKSPSIARLALQHPPLLQVVLRQPVLDCSGLNSVALSEGIID